jgi:3-dehydroquinate synthase
MNSYPLDDRDEVRDTARPVEAGGTPDSIDAEFAVRYVHRLRFTDDAFDPDNPVLADVIRAGRKNLPAKALVFIDEGLLRHWPDLDERVRAYAAAHEATLCLAGPNVHVPGGERTKNDRRQLESMLERIDRAGLCRQSYVLAIGGGAVLDAVGFAASSAHRGVRLIRFPTTTLSQCDSGVGVKNGINLFGKKNFYGTFDVPCAVINDERFLSSLSDRDWRAGFSEAVKVALIKDRAFFERIVALERAITSRDQAASTPVLRRAAELHLSHITDGGDPFETTSARPLDFGHWAAHKLEQLTDFRLRHGEAVAIGLALDTCYSALAGLIDWGSAGSVLGCLERLGFTLYDEALENTDDLLEGIEEFRQHLGGRLTVTLLRRIGRGVDVHEMDRDKILGAIEHLAGSAASEECGA